MPAADLYKVSEDYSRVDEICRAQSFKSLQLLIRVKAEENQFQEQTVKYVIVKC
jgi:hypothetical protein